MGLDVCFNSQSTLRPMIFDILRLSTYGTGPRKLESSVKHVGCCWPVAAIGADLVDPKVSFIIDRRIGAEPCSDQQMKQVSGAQHSAGIRAVGGLILHLFKQHMATFFDCP